ncbi:diguanylate cyclase [Pseudoalteromonas sp. SSDWG2]|uniref:GGDEF domain-containing protein n=1 Tax=Pseudoalteromonas sp. SSDWG2 TaxID=3139391 RepID=UPI003BA96721
MTEPALPDNEEERIAAVQLLKLLDTPAEERFDRITRIAKHMFGVQISVISLVDTNRQWFKSKQGLDVEETPRSMSFCGHAINQDDPLVIPDALMDARFLDNPLVTGEPFIRFYAGCPLHAPGGFRVGTLCLIDTRPRLLTEKDIDMLKELALMVEHELEATTKITLDALTSISNRRGFEMLAQHSLAYCQREQRNACLLYLDLDNFKVINDTCGHHVGDQVLKDFAVLLSQSFRASDVFARLGGDEFVVLFTSIDETKIEELVARLEQGVKNYNAKHQGEFVLEYSIGYAQFTGEQSLEELIHTADTRMYSDKEKKIS